MLFINDLLLCTCSMLPLQLLELSCGKGFNQFENLMVEFRPHLMAMKKIVGYKALIVILRLLHSTSRASRVSMHISNIYVHMHTLTDQGRSP